MATLPPAWCVLPSDSRAATAAVGHREQDGNAASCSGRRDGGVKSAARLTKAVRRRRLPARMRLSSPWLRSYAFGSLPAGPTNRAAHNRTLEVDNVLFSESWSGSEGNTFCGPGDEAMVLALAAVKAARDAASYKNAMDVKKREFQLEFDTPSLERASLNNMENSFRIGCDAEAAMLTAEQKYVQKLELLIEGASTSAKSKASPRRDEESAVGLPRSRNVAVKSNRKNERFRKRERALEKAGKVAFALASSPPVPKADKSLIKHRLSDPICSYLRDVKNSKLLTAFEEVALSRKIQVTTLFRFRQCF